MSKKMSSYKMRVIENNELRVKNKELMLKIKELERAVEILNVCISGIQKISKEFDVSLVKDFENLFEEIDEDKKSNTIVNDK